MHGGLSVCCWAPLPGWALTLNCEQMGLVGSGGDRSCLPEGGQLWGPRVEHLDPAEEHLTLGAASPSRAPEQPVGETRPPSCLSGPLKRLAAGGQASGGSSAFWA